MYANAWTKRLLSFATLGRFVRIVALDFGFVLLSASPEFEAVCASRQFLKAADECVFDV
jgi:hypothetical protein